MTLPTDAADIYRRTLTSLGPEPTCWWYLGTTTFVTDGHPEIIVNHVETAMLYRAKPLDAKERGGAFRVPWWEIGVFRDAITGEVANDWTNPLTGETVPAARMFEEGPSGYTIRPAGDGIELVDAVQAFAKLETASVTVEEHDGRVSVTQIEEKVRAFPQRDGIPDLDRGQSTRSRTVLQWFADAKDLAGDAPSVPSTGLYSFTIGAPPWLGMGDRPGVFSVKGLMHKDLGFGAPLSPPLNPRGWADLKTLFPHYFDGDVIQPRWG